LKEIRRLDKQSRKIIRSAIIELVTIHSIIQALLKVVLDLQETLLGMDKLQFELILSTLEGNGNSFREGEYLLSQSIDDSINNSLLANIYFNSLPETFPAFEAQAAGIAGIQLDYLQTILWSIPGKSDLSSDVPVETKQLNNWTDTILESFSEIRKLSECLEDFSGTMNRVFKISEKTAEAQEHSRIASLKEDSLKALSSIRFSGKEAPQELYPPESSKGHITSEIVDDDDDSYRSDTLSSPRVIEIPTLIPKEGILKHDESTAVNVNGILDIVPIEYNKSGALIYNQGSLPIHLETRAVSLPSKSPRSSRSFASLSSETIHMPLDILNAFNFVYDLFTDIPEISNIAVKLLAPSELEISNTLKEAYSNHLLLPKDAISILSLKGVSLRRDDILDANERSRNIILSMDAVGALQNSGFTAIKDIASVVPYSEAYHRSPTDIAPQAMSAVSQILSLSRSIETPRIMGEKGVRIQNTFNIVVNAKNGDKEAEIRELGRKIGLVLSEEMRRYGGII
jgi:hypothetical protein